MSTIATPRDPGAFRRTPSSQAVVTPTSSTRPSLDLPRSTTSSPNPNSGVFPPSSSSTTTPTTTTAAAPKRANRAALREYYNLKKNAAAAAAAAGGGGGGGGSVGGGSVVGTPLLEVTDTDSVAGDDQLSSYSEVPLSEFDADGFEADAYVRAKLRDSGLEELLRTYTRVLGEIRALDAEKKALVYDNYSKLITATETIRKMRANMDPLNPMASTLDPAIAQIYSQASSIREALRESTPRPEDGQKRDEERARKRRTRELVSEVLDTPRRVRALVAEGRVAEAEEAWRLPKKMLLRWKERGVGGQDVDAVLADGEAALKGEGKEAPSST